MGKDIKIVKNIFATAGTLNGDFQGVMKTAVLMATAAKRSAPRDSGRLRNSIMYTANRADGYAEEGGFNTGSGEQATSDEKLDRRALGGGFLRATAWVGTNVFYAPYVEYGTRRQQPQPYLRPALDVVRNPSGAREIVQQWRDEMQKAYAAKKIDTRGYL